MRQLVATRRLSLCKSKLSRIELSIYQKFNLPSFLFHQLSKFPDVEYVQLMAYHLIIAFRRLLDEVLEEKIDFGTFIERRPSRWK